VAQEILALHVAPAAPNNPEMMFAAGVASLRMPILPSEVPAKQHDVVAMAGKTFWDLASKPPEEAESDFTKLLAAYPDFPNVHYFLGTSLGARHPEQCAAEFLAELRVSPDSVPARVQTRPPIRREGKPARRLNTPGRRLRSVPSLWERSWLLGAPCEPLVTMSTHLRPT